MSLEKGLDLEAIRVRLQSWFEIKMPQVSELSLSPFQKPERGGSNETFFFDLRWKEAGSLQLKRLVIRWRPMRCLLFPKHDMKEQFLILKHLENSGLPVPQARWLEENESFLGSPFYIVDRVAGWIPEESPAYHLTGPLYEAKQEDKARIWWLAVDTMAKINSLDWQRLGLDFLDVPGRGTDPIDQHIAYYERMLLMDEETPSPLLEAGMNWLKKNCFEPKNVSLCWGDARLGNLIYRNDQVAAVLDWEMARIGDPESDLAWFLHMDWYLSEGNAHQPAPRLKGLPSREETIDHYEHVTGRKVGNLFYHEVFALWRAIVIFTRLEHIHKRFGSLPPEVDINIVQRERLKGLLGL